MESNRRGIGFPAHVSLCHAGFRRCVPRQKPTLAHGEPPDVQHGDRAGRRSFDLGARSARCGLLAEVEQRSDTPPFVAYALPSSRNNRLRGDVEPRHSRGSNMRFIVIAAIMAGSFVGVSTEAQARGCITGAIIGGLAGHAVHHGIAGAAAGCAAGSGASHYYKMHKSKAALHNDQRAVTPSVAQ